MRPVLEYVVEGEERIADVIERLAQKFGLSPEGRAKMLPSGKPLPLGTSRVSATDALVWDLGSLAACVIGQQLGFPARTLQINSPPGADRTESDEVAQWRARCGHFAEELDDDDREEGLSIRAGPGIP